MVSAIIGGAVALATTAASITANQIAASKQAKAQQRLRAALESDENKTRHELEREENESALERADVRLGLTEAKEALDRQSDAAAGQAAVMGTTNAGVAAQKEAAMRSFAEAQAKTIAAGDAAKQERIDKKEEQLMGIRKEQRNADYEAEMQNIQNMQNSVQAANQMAASAGTIAASVAGGQQTTNIQQSAPNTSNNTGTLNAAQQQVANSIAANVKQQQQQMQANVNKQNNVMFKKPDVKQQSDYGKYGKWSSLFKPIKPTNKVN